MFSLMGASTALAASTMSLTPASGNIDADGTTLTLNFNSNGTSVAGASVKISFTGSVTYQSSNSTVCNQSFDVQSGTGSIVIACLFTESKTFNGSIGTFVFRSGASTGSSVFTLSNSDPSDATLSGGTYTLVSTSDGRGLPGTGIFDMPVYLVVGFTLIVFGVGIFFSTRRSERLLLEKEEKEYEEFINSPKMSEKIKGR